MMQSRPCALTHSLRSRAIARGLCYASILPNSGWCLRLDRCTGAGAASLLLLAVLPAIGTGAHAADCRGEIRGGTAIAGKTAYNPFSPVEISDQYRIVIANIGSGDCRYGLVFRSGAAQPKLGQALSYQITDQAHRELISNLPAAAAPIARSGAPLGASQTAQIAFEIRIPRGQCAAPGASYSDRLELDLHAIDETGRADGPVLQSTALSISYAVEQVLSVNIKGAQSTTTLDFGALAKGQQRTVEIQARSNQSYQLNVTSDNNGALALTPKVAGQDWRVPYTLSLGGQQVDLARTGMLTIQPPTRPEADAGHMLRVTIGDVGQKRAGRYEDVLTIEIKGATP
jgi:hypothetical protein